MAISIKESAGTKVITLEAKTGKGDDAIKTTFEAELPLNLAAAIEQFGEQEVYGKFIKAKVVELQGVERNKLRPKEEGKERVKASYLEQLGL